MEYDQGSDFKAAFAAVLEACSVQSKCAGLECAWQNGTAEAHAATLRTMTMKVVEDGVLRGETQSEWL